MALELLALLRMCFKDLAAPDFRQDLYTKIEIQVQPLLDNFMCPPLRHYKKQLIQIINTMIVICREITPTLQEVMKEIITLAESSSTIISTKTLALFTSHGTEHFKKDITLYESLAHIF